MLIVCEPRMCEASVLIEVFDLIDSFLNKVRT